MSKTNLHIVMMGATGAVGTEVIKELLMFPNLEKLTLLGRNKFSAASHKHLVQYKIDITDPSTYSNHIANHNIAICTLGIGQPSKVSRETFIQIDRQAVYEFAKQCKSEGVRHFELLSSVDIDSNSKSFYLKTKGELVEELKALNFERLSIFQPSMILTPTNRYGWSQGIILKIWPLLDKLFLGGLKKYKGIKVSHLGKSIAQNVLTNMEGLEYLSWNDFQKKY